MDKAFADNLNIVIVDDEEVNLILFEALLEKKGFSVKKSFNNPIEAKKYILQYGCDILLVDYNMPDVNGATLIKDIKVYLPDLISIMITADQTNDTMIEALNAGANDVLLKPISSASFELKFKNMTQLAASLKVTKEHNSELQLEASFYQNVSQENALLLGQYEKLINTSSAFLRVDTTLEIIDINDVYCSILKANRNTLVGSSVKGILAAEFVEEHVGTILRELSEKGVWHGIMKVNTFDKNIIYLDSSINAIYNEFDTIIEYMAVAHDVTELISIQDEIQKTQSDVVFTMGSIGETRSKETGNHVKRVAEYSKELALLYGLSKEDAELLKTASPMHDIGKVGIPDAILNKPGRLTAEEFTIMKTHSILGYQMLKHSTRPILKTAALVAKEHHEKWDGSGYTKGKKAEDIHIFGRITALADVFDALGSDRCYKKAWEDEHIFELLKEQREKHFDPKLVDLFFDNLALFLNIREMFKD